jgi:hypothetical protein
LLCPFVANLWNWLGLALRVIFYCSSLTSIFESCSQGWSNQVHHLALAAIIHVLHTTWMARNGIRFNNAKIFLHAAKTKINTALALSDISFDQRSLSLPRGPYFALIETSCPLAP